MAALSDLPRLTAAISAALTEQAIPHAVSGAMAMGAHGYVRATSDLNLLVAAPAVRVPAIPYHHEVLCRAVPTEVAGQMVPVVTVEDLVILKLLWNRTKDRADVQALLAAVAVDEDYLRTTLLGMLPDDDPRQEQMDALLRRFRH